MLGLQHQLGRLGGNLIWLAVTKHSRTHLQFACCSMIGVRAGLWLVWWLLCDLLLMIGSWRLITQLRHDLRTHRDGFRQELHVSPRLVPSANACVLIL